MFVKTLVVLFLLILSWVLTQKHIIKEITITFKELKEANIRVSRMVVELKESNQIKDKFFDLIAHDLRSPFTAILGFSEVLLEKNDYREEEKREFIQNIYQSGRSANELLSRLLDWARLQTGRWIPNPHSFDVRKTISMVESLHHANALHGKVTLISTIKKHCYVYADESMVETTLRNLVSNSLKFTQPGGLVTITAIRNNTHIEIIVSDSGKGMDIDCLNSLFVIGKHTVSTDLSGKRGTGLGLILCKEFVEKNGGEIWVDSELGKGSQFHFTIPLA